MNIDMRVNELPARTYRWLQLNGEDINEQDISFSSFAMDIVKAPEGVSIAEDVDGKEAEKVFAPSYEQRVKADENLVGPNGDTSINHAGQIVRTGMGSGVDALLESAGVRATVIKAADKTSVSEPVMLHDHLCSSDSAISRQVIVVPDGSSLTVIMDYDSDEDASGIEAVSTKFYVGKGATLRLVKIQMLGKKVRHFDDLGGVVMDNGRFELVQMEIGAIKAYAGAYVSLLGREAVSDNNTGFLGTDDQFYDFNYVAEQRGVKTSSMATYRGVLDGRAVKNWRGSLDFREGSVGGEGNEQEDTLLLSPDVVNRSIPLILCKEENVDGRHGATIGQLSDDMLFYMEARGIDKETAKKIMVRARLDSIARMIPDEKLKDKVSSYLDEIL